MKRDYTKLDAAILARLRAAAAAVPLHRIDTGTEGAAVRRELPLSTLGGPDFWCTARRLQALRKAGRIRYQRKPEGWVLAA